MADSYPCPFCMSGTMEYFAPGRSHQYFECDACGKTDSKVAEMYQ